MTRVKERLNLFYHGIRTSERAEMFADVRSWLAEMDDGQPAEDERVNEIRERLVRFRNPAKAKPGRCTSSCGSSDYDSDRHTHVEGCRFEAPAADATSFWENAPDDIDYLLSLLPVRPAQTVDLSLLPYEIAEELPKIGGEFGKLAAMCKSHVAAFIEKLITTRTVQPAASTPTEKYDAETDAMFDDFLRTDPSVQYVLKQEAKKRAAASTEARDEMPQRHCSVHQRQEFKYESLEHELHETDVDKWRRELTEAGWIAESATAWRSPNGGLYRGPYGAWIQLQRQKGVTNA